MAGYQSMYGSGTAAPAKSDGNYHSYFGFATQANPTAQQLAQLRQQQAAQAMQNQVQQKAAPQHQTLLNRVQGVATALGHAGQAVARPVTDVIGGTASAVNNEIHNKPVTTAALGKAVHDTAQLSSDVTGGTVNQLAKGVAQAPGAVAGEIASQSKNPYVRAQGVQAVQGAQKKAFGTNDSGTIAKKIIGSTVGTGSMFVGGGELAGSKVLLSKGAAVAGKQVAKDAAIGATGNATATVTQNPNASAKDIGKSAAVGGLLGAVAPHAIKAAGDAGRAGASKIAASDSKLLQPVKDVANTVTGNAAQGQNDLLQAKQNALLSKASSLEAPQTSATHVPVTPHVSYEPTNPRVKTLIDSAQKQQQAAEAPMKAAQAQQDKAAAQAEKAQVDGQKVDRQIELLQAKGKDSETGLSNVDQTKLQHLQEDKAQASVTPQPGEVIKPTAPVEPVAKPVSESPNAAAPAKVETAQPAVAKESSVDNTAKPPTISNRKQTEIKQNGIEPTVVPVPEPKAEPVGEIKTSKLANRAETIGLKKSLTEAFHDKPEYAAVNMSKQAEATASLLKSDPQRLISIAMGHEKPPEGILPESAWVAAVNHATKTKDGELIRQLGTQSSLVSEATGMGQRIRALGELNPYNPAKAVKTLSKTRQDAYKAKTGKSANAAAQSEIKQIRAATPKATVTKETFNSFVESLKCH